MDAWAGLVLFLILMESTVVGLTSTKRLEGFATLPRADGRPVSINPDDHTSAPFGAIFILIIASIVCQFFIPADIQPVGALRVPATILAVGLLAGPLWYSRTDPRLLFQPAFVLAMAPVFWLLLDMIQGSYAMWGFERADVQKTFFTISLFSVCGWITALRPRYWLVRAMPVGVFRQFSPQFYFSIGLAAFGLAFLRFAMPAEFDLPAMYNALLENRWAAPWARGAIGGWDAFLDHLSYFGYILPVLTVVLARRVGWLSPRTILLGTCAIVITLLLAQGGGRRIIGVMFGSAVAYWFLSLPRVRVMALIGLCSAVIALGAAANFMLEVRDRGLGERLEQPADQRPFVEDESESDFVFLHIDDNFLRLTQMNYVFPTFVPYTTWQYILYTFCKPIPRVFWPGKPTSPGFSLAGAVGAEGVGLTCSAVGELVMCGGYFAIALGGLFYGFIASSLTPLRSKRYGAPGLLLYSCGMLMLFEGVRAVGELVLMSYMLLAYVALATFYDRFAGRE